MSDAGSLARALFSRRWLLVTLGVLLLMGVLARLGFWQLDRLEQRRAANAALVAALDSPPIDLNDRASSFASLSDVAALEALRNRDVVVRGEYDLEHEFIVKLQSYEGQPGVNLLTPLLLDGPAGPLAVLVDRGWIPDDALEGGDLSAFAPEPAGALRGYVALTETLRRGAGATPVPGKEIYRVDIASLQRELPYPLLPFYIKDAPPEGGDTAAPFRTPREVDLSEGPHLDYAIQWFVFSLGLGVGYVIFVWRKQTAEREKAARPAGRMNQV